LVDFFLDNPDGRLYARNNKKKSSEEESNNIPLALHHAVCHRGIVTSTQKGRKAENRPERRKRNKIGKTKA
jgi:hypothetical protein